LIYETVKLANEDTRNMIGEDTTYAAMDRTQETQLKVGVTGNTSYIDWVMGLDWKYTRSHT
jgi:hypothetical protein